MSNRKTNKQPETAVEEREEAAVTGEEAVTDVEPARETVMYIGPTITNVVRKSTVFLDGVLPDGFNRLVHDEPLLKRLLVPLDGIRGAIKELNDSESPLRTIHGIIRNKYR